MTRALALFALIGVAAAGCASARQGRFKDQPIVWQVFIDGYMWNRLTDAVDPPSTGPARDTNALDEVPNSTWYENRIGLRDVTPEELARGADELGPPQLPLTIVHAKGSGNPGFFAEDSRGVRYLIKFDTAHNPEQQTAGDIIVNRLFWAIGYHVPSDHVFHFQRSELRIGEKMVGKLDDKDIDGLMAGAVRRDDGSIRAVASEFLPGKPRGGWPGKGRRSDDLNDTIPHQHRRVVRGLRVFSAWLGHTDIKPDNTLDMYVEQDGRHFLRHYLVDFGEALGGHQSEKDIAEIGWEYGFDWGSQAAAFVSFGLWVRDWEDQKETPWPSIGYFGADQFDPDGWRERYPYEPFFYIDRSDEYWAAKIVMRFDRAHIEAAVAEGMLTNPKAAAYLVDTLVARRDKIGAAYLDDVTPLDEFAITAGKLCATDLGRKYGLANDGVVEQLGAPGARYAVGSDSRVCIPLAADDDYRVLRVRIRRTNGTTPPMQIHYKGGNAARILGIVRE